MLLVVAVAGGVALLWLAANLLFLVFGGILLAVFLRAVTEPIAQRTPLSERWALSVLLLGFVVIVGLAVWIFGPQLAGQVEGMGEEITEIAGEVRETLEGHPLGQRLVEALEGGEEDGAALEWVSGFFFGALEGLVYFLTFLLVGIFVAYRPALYTRGVVRLFPIRHREHVRDLLGELGYILRWWLIGRALAMLMVGISTTVLLTLLGIPLALLLGITAGLLTFVPYLGPLAASIPIAVVSLLEGPTELLYALGLYAIIEHIEGYVLDPIIQHIVVYLPPAFTVAFQVLMGLLFGALGIALATPLAAVGMIIVQRSYIEHTLGDYDTEEEESGEEKEAGRKPAEVPDDGEA